MNEKSENKRNNFTVVTTISNSDRMKGGSQQYMRSFICKNLAERLNLRVIRKEHLIVYTFGNRQPKEKIFDGVKVTISNKKHPERSTECELLISDTITNAVIATPNVSIENQIKSNHMTHLDLSLSQSNKEILINGRYEVKLHIQNDVNIGNGTACQLRV
ncbi:UNVERIFIED_CONTAM: hypothetical protein NCL1_57656 [Trichonephila clavipes]